MSTRTHSRTTSTVGRIVALSLVAAAVMSGPLGAQSAQMLSLQFSGLAMYPFGGEMDKIDAGAGWEAQLRVNPSAFSLGVGAEQTFHKRTTGQDIVLLGGFIEPRYVLDIGSDAAVLYVSARAALSQITIKLTNSESTGTGYTLNGGGGLLFNLSPRVNLDAGATIGYKDLGVIDLPSQLSIDLGTGANVVGRVGLAIGIG